MSITFIRTPRGRVARAGNYLPNPRLDVDASGWLSLNGGGQVTQARTASNLPNVSWCWLVTWTTGTATPQGGFSTQSAQVTAGGQYVYSLYVVCTKPQRVKMTVVFSDGTVVDCGDTIITAGGTWVRLNSPALVTPPGATSARITVGATAGTGGVKWNANDAFGGTAAAVTNGPVLYEFFDGNTGASGDLTYSWVGTPGLSTSLSLWSDPSTIVNPDLIEGYDSSQDSRNVFHQLADGPVVAALMPASTRQGTLRLIFKSAAAAASARTAFAGAGSWAFTDTGQLSEAMYFGVAGKIRKYQSDSRKKWLLEIPYQELS